VLHDQVTTDGKFIVAMSVEQSEMETRTRKHVSFYDVRLGQWVHSSIYSDEEGRDEELDKNELCADERGVYHNKYFSARDDV